jgi:ketosteroid isomerase-like protein
MTGAVNPDGSARPELRGLLSWVMQRQSDGSWLIVVMHNTPLKGYPAN